MKSRHLTSTCATVLVASFIFATETAAQTIFVDQGQRWTETRRVEFYFGDQGSRIMPLTWMRALTLPDGEGFLNDGLARYGYLAHAGAPAPDIPVGFTVAPSPGGPSIGMTCAACHTREIEVNGLAIRIDGGPAMVDFQAFLSDLDAAMATALSSDEAFTAFADRVIGSGRSATERQQLRADAELWHMRFHTITEKSLENVAWGPGRLDAVSMIFNRLAGLDLGDAPDFMIPENIAPAVAPTRYPFLWNAARQDKTQWPGFAANGNDLLGLARNLGEVYGVFGDFRPVKQAGFFRLDRDYISQNSANFDGLLELEDLIWKIGPPKWPWAIDQALADEGEAIFARDAEEGGCVSCHGIETGAKRAVLHRTWRTPILDVGTDTKECEILARTVKTGVLEGAKLPFSGRLGAEEPAFKVLSTSVIGAIAQHALGYQSQVDADAFSLETVAEGLPPDFDDLRHAFPDDDDLVLGLEAGAVGCAYESRVLEGIWASAPYLHNGSVASLADLLKPAAKRQVAFKLGPNYDIETVGLSVEQSAFDFVLETTGCENVASGNSRCGHEYGTRLSDAERRALLEYLKTL